MKPCFLTITPDERNGRAQRARLAHSPIILKLLHEGGQMNVNEISASLKLPQSTIATNIQVLEEAGLIVAKSIPGRKGQQKVCSARYQEIVLRFDSPAEKPEKDMIEVSMPLGLFTNCEVSAPCGLCSPEGIIGLLDVPESFLDPDRLRAALAWFGRGFVEYKFPNNAKLMGKPIDSVEFSMELSSEVPGTNLDWPSDITVWVNDVPIGTWTSPGDYGDKRGVYTPDWWKLEGSQYGKLKTWRVSELGTFVDGVRISEVTTDQLDLSIHHSIRLRLGIDPDSGTPRRGQPVRQGLRQLRPGRDHAALSETSCRPESGSQESATFGVTNLIIS